METKKTVFETLSQVDMNQYVKTVQNQKYIAWSDAWNAVKKIYPLARFSVDEDANGNPFFMSPLGIVVRVTVEIDGEVQTLNHPVLNSANKAMKEMAYEYKVKAGARSVAGATAYDVNTAQMRGLVKCLALHGMALYIYRDEIGPDMDTIDSHQIQAIIDKIKEKNLILTEVCAAWQVPKIANLWEVNFDRVMDWLEYS